MGRERSEVSLVREREGMIMEVAEEVWNSWIL